MKKLCGLLGVVALLVCVGCQPADEPAPGGGATGGSNTTSLAPTAETQLS